MLKLQKKNKNRAWEVHDLFAKILKVPYEIFYEIEVFVKPIHKSEADACFSKLPEKAPGYEETYGTNTTLIN